MLIVFKEQEEQYYLLYCLLLQIIRILLMNLFFGQRKNIKTCMEKWSGQNRTSRTSRTDSTTLEVSAG